MINVTESATNQVKRMLEDKKLTGYGIRLGVKGGGCSGMTYVMNFDNEVRQDDQVFDVEGVKVIVDAKSLTFLDGMTIDYKGDLMGGGFAFVNPNAKNSCGCGTSFSV